MTKWHEVYIPLSNREVFEEGSANIHHSVAQWLFGQNADFENALFVWDEETNVAVGVKFGFTDPNLALMFKLRFGGTIFD
jgi:hypothetical protein